MRWLEIERLIGRVNTVAFVLSPDLLNSNVALKEVAYAASLDKRFAPVVVQRVDDKLVPDALGRLNFIFFDQQAKFDESFDRLCEALETDIVRTFHPELHIAAGP